MPKCIRCNEINDEDLLLSLCLVVGRQFVEQFAVYFHKSLKDVVDESHDRLVPVFLGNSVEGREHDRQDDVRILLDQAHYVFIVPKIERTLRHLSIKERHNFGTTLYCICTMYAWRHMHIKTFIKYRM